MSLIVAPDKYVAVYIGRDSSIIFLNHCKNSWPEIVPKRLVCFSAGSSQRNGCVMHSTGLGSLNAYGALIFHSISWKKKGNDGDSYLLISIIEELS